ncbi:MAG: hypothetical protein R6X02_27860 [Enhygromyxa sp.]
MQGLLALAWLSPKDPNLLDKLFGRFAIREQHYENQIDIALVMLAIFLVALAWRVFRDRARWLKSVAPALDEKLAEEKTRTLVERLVTAALVVIALLASVNYFYGSRNNGVYVHRWDAFHTVIGAKYHTELGYFDLYKCAYAIDREGPHHFRTVETIRDLHTRKFVPREQHIAGNDCKQRFTPERLEQFKHDLDEFGTWSSKREWRILFKDKGFNGTPFYATLAKGLVSTIDVNLDSLKRLAVIDPVVMLIAFGVVGWAFGARRAAIMAIFFCVFFPNRFVHMGGSILRFDYVAALMIGFSALKKDRWGLAGAMFAWATMVRVFPAIFAVGVGLKIAADVVEHRKIREEHWRFAGFFAGGLLLFFVISLIGMDGGFENWRTWAENMKVHNAKSASFRVGFKHLFMIDGKLTSSNYGAKQELLEARKAYYWIAVAVLFAPLLLAVRRLDLVSFGVMFGVFGFFLLAIATRYYYGVVALLFLIDRKPLQNRYMLIMGALLFFVSALDFIYFQLNNNNTFMYNTLIGVELAVVIAMMGSWLLFNPSLLDVGEDPRLPKLVPARLGARAVAVVVEQPEEPVPEALPAIHERVTMVDGPRVPADEQPDDGQGS